MTASGAASQLYLDSIEFGCVDLRLHPNEKVASHYRSIPPNGRSYLVADMRRYPINLRHEFMDALGDYWDKARGPCAGHKITLGMKVCIELLVDVDADTFMGLSYEARPKRRTAAGRYFDMLTTPRELRNQDDDDVWKIDEMGLHPSRLNPARPVNRLDFRSIKNDQTRAVIKAYTRHTLQEDSIMLSTIAENLSKLKEFAKFMGDKPILHTTVEDVARFEQYCLSRWTVKYSSSKMRKAKKLFNWLEDEGAISSNPFAGYAIKNDYRKQIKVTAPDDSVIAQIGEILPSLPLHQILHYLILKCTGMRVSELCQLKVDCLEQTSEGHCFIRFWNQKMSKDVQNVIPPSLHRLIAEYVKILPSGSTYLFPTTFTLGSPATCSRLVENLADALEEAGVKNPDGTPYRFAPHSMRHKMAVQLCEIGAPYKVIQEQLHHAEPDMSVAYTEFDIRRKAAKVSKFIDGDGVEKPCFVATARDVVETRVDWMKERLTAQILPNGVCGRPVALGECGKCNACLSCPDFRTSAEFLDVHKSHLAQTRHFMKAAKAAGWVNQLDGAKELEGRLLRIIEKLEG